MTKKSKNVKISNRVRRSYASFDELKKHLSQIQVTKTTRLTIILDKLTLKGASYEEYVKLANRYRKNTIGGRDDGKSNDFLTPARVRSHIKFRERHNRFVYDYTDDIVKLVNVR